MGNKSKNPFVSCGNTADDATNALTQIARVIYWHGHGEPYGSEGKWPAASAIQAFLKNVSESTHRLYQDLFLTHSQQVELEHLLQFHLLGGELHQFQLRGKEMDPLTRTTKDALLVTKIQQVAPGFTGPAFREEHLSQDGKPEGPMVNSFARLAPFAGCSEPTLRQLNRSKKKPHLQEPPPEICRREASLWLVMEALGYDHNERTTVADALLKPPPMAWVRQRKESKEPRKKRWLSRLCFWKK